MPKVLNSTCLRKQVITTTHCDMPVQTSVQWYSNQTLFAEHNADTRTMHLSVAMSYSWPFITGLCIFLNWYHPVSVSGDMWKVTIYYTPQCGLQNRQNVAHIAAQYSLDCLKAIQSSPHVSSSLFLATDKVLWSTSVMTMLLRWLLANALPVS